MRALYFVRPLYIYETYTVCPLCIRFLDFKFYMHLPSVQTSLKIGDVHLSYIKDLCHSLCFEGLHNIFLCIWRYLPLYMLSTPMLCSALATRFLVASRGPLCIVCVHCTVGPQARNMVAIGLKWYTHSALGNNTSHSPATCPVGGGGGGLVIKIIAKLLYLICDLTR